MSRTRNEVGAAYTPASDWPRQRIAAGLCPVCPDGRGVMVGRAADDPTTELYDCDTCDHSWFRGTPTVQLPLFEGA